MNRGVIQTVLVLIAGACGLLSLFGVGPAHELAIGLVALAIAALL